MATVICIQTRAAFETEARVPRFSEFLATKIGKRWYTSSRPKKIMGDRVYVCPKTFDALEAEYEATYGVAAP